ncbi:hypothetical protein EIN_026860 [Entamoeba invadens IP1]|uniref:hypothetical protein n=1 Tax=Entamoeba invadens IP1 TaxID=370355 RepID=UPI0002C3FA72|nr:hypothetical protein EIN_026860 [Entamoeba invadens IP1]ELP90807.1 hypothetical protein EIN_026860 [Entamoeba invadens IP1]|eukprot:XP_004257578.1 hypothetical protein EIN_026860 [Entamoeba invadens IP1]
METRDFKTNYAYNATSSPSCDFSKSVDSFPHKAKSVSSSPKYVANKRELKNFDTYQQSFLIGLLNNHCGCTLKKQRKQTTVTSTTPVLKILHFQDEDYEIMQLADAYCRPEYVEDIKTGMSKTTAFRRIDKNRRNFTQNLLIDICMEFGYFFESCLSRKSKKTLRLERIQEVYNGDKRMFSQLDITQKGKKINDYFVSEFQKSSVVSIEVNCKVIQEILWGNK